MKIAFIMIMTVAAVLVFCSPQPSEHSHGDEQHSHPHDQDTVSHGDESHSHDEDDHFHQEEFTIDSTSTGEHSHEGVAE